MDWTDRIGAALAVSLLTLTACADQPAPGPVGSEDMSGTMGTKDPAPNPDPMDEPDPEHSVLVALGDIPVFEPSMLTIKVGETVRWDFLSEGHSVVSGMNGMADGRFCAPNNQDCAKAPAQAAGAAYSFKFSQAGTYSYFCRAHLAEGMTGTITVTP
jgi:plastocyanin